MDGSAVRNASAILTETGIGGYVEVRRDEKTQKFGLSAKSGYEFTTIIISFPRTFAHF